jgi:hypothetical protein
LSKKIKKDALIATRRLACLEYNANADIYFATVIECLKFMNALLITKLHSIKSLKLN